MIPQFSINDVSFDKTNGNVLKFMASNGLVANAKKTMLMFLKNKSNKDELMSIKIGQDTICEVASAKLIGITVDNN